MYTKRAFGAVLAAKLVVAEHKISHEAQSIIEIRI
jgi:hypothetical protein